VTVVVKPMIGTAGKHIDVDTGIDRIYVCQVEIVEGVAVEKEIGIGYCKREPDADFSIIGKVTPGELLDIRLALSERDAAITGKSKLDHNTRNGYNIDGIMEIDEIK